jgi:hypothetical protein
LRPSSSLRFRILHRSTRSQTDRNEGSPDGVPSGKRLGRRGTAGGWRCAGTE